MGTTIRTKTWIEQDEAGWWCVVGFWHAADPREVGNERTDSDDGMRVGPFPSRQVARRELRGKFREIVTLALRDFIAANDGKVVAAAFGE